MKIRKLSKNVRFLLGLTMCVPGWVGMRGRGRMKWVSVEELGVCDERVQSLQHRPKADYFFREGSNSSESADAVDQHFRMGYTFQLRKNW